jgi:hypothetical protein|tara:strand:- start:89 stop:517 length:429 start_codon:yes stop_codon:yes gene_type:complete
MINGIKLNTNNISMNQRRLRLKELALGTNSLTIKDKERLQPRHSKCITEVVSMVEIPKNRTQLVPKKPQPQLEDEIDLEEILKEMGYGESEDIGDDIDEDEGYNDFIGMMSKSELKQMIQGIVLDSLDEEDDLNEIIENLTR